MVNNSYTSLIHTLIHTVIVAFMVKYSDNLVFHTSHWQIYIDRWPAQALPLRVQIFLFNIQNFQKVAALAVHPCPPMRSMPLYMGNPGLILLKLRPIFFQTICSARNMFLHLNPCWPGSAHDSRVFKESALYDQFEDSKHKGFLLGDSTYAL